MQHLADALGLGYCRDAALIWFGKLLVLLPCIGHDPVRIVNPALLGLYTQRLHTGKLTFIINPAACLSFEVLIIHASLWVCCIPGSIKRDAVPLSTFPLSIHHT